MKGDIQEKKAMLCKLFCQHAPISTGILHACVIFTFALWIQSVFYHDKSLPQKEENKVGEKEGEEEEEGWKGKVCIGYP